MADYVYTTMAHLDPFDKVHLKDGGMLPDKEFLIVKAEVKEEFLDRIVVENMYQDPDGTRRRAALQPGIECWVTLEGCMRSLAERLKYKREKEDEEEEEETDECQSDQS